MSFSSNLVNLFSNSCDITFKLWPGASRPRAPIVAVKIKRKKNVSNHQQQLKNLFNKSKK